MSRNEINALDTNLYLQSNRDWSKTHCTKSVGYCFAVGKPICDASFTCQRQDIELYICKFWVSNAFVKKYGKFCYGQYGEVIWDWQDTRFDLRYRALEVSFKKYGISKDFILLNAERY